MIRRPRPRPKRSRRSPKNRSIQRAHARRKFWGRFGKELSLAEYEALVRKIVDNGGGENNGESVFLFKESNRVSHWAVRKGGRWYAVPFDRHRKAIATFLPPEALWPHLDRIVVTDDQNGC